MYIAIYHNHDIHHEMLGYLLEFCITNNYKTDLYFTVYNNEKLYVKTKMWFKWYNMHFKNPENIKYINSTTLLHDNYKIIFLVTDDHIFYANYVPKKFYKKTISIDHWYEIRNILKHHVSVRPYTDKRPVAYPIYNIIDINEKRQVMKKDRIQLFFIGRYNYPTSDNLLLFEDIENIDIHYINWDSGNRFKYLQKLPNFYIHEQLSTIELISLLKTGHYIFLQPCYIEGYNGNKLSSLIPLGLSTLCQCIIPNSWNSGLNLKSPLIYDDKDYVSPMGQIKLNLKKFTEKLGEIEFEKQKLINERNDTFKMVINAVLEENEDDL